MNDDETKQWTEVLKHGKLGNIRLSDSRLHRPLGVVIIVDEKPKWILRARDKSELALEPYW